jgi:hypothetical protein
LRPRSLQPTMARWPPWSRVPLTLCAVRRPLATRTRRVMPWILVTRSSSEIRKASPVPHSVPHGVRWRAANLAAEPNAGRQHPVFKTGRRMQPMRWMVRLHRRSVPPHLALALGSDGVAQFVERRQLGKGNAQPVCGLLVIGHGLLGHGLRHDPPAGHALVVEPTKGTHKGRIGVGFVPRRTVTI